MKIQYRLIFLTVLIILIGYVIVENRADVFCLLYTSPSPRDTR